METVAATALQDSERIETAFDDLKKAFSGSDCAPIGDLTYSIGVEVVPTIKWTGDYRKLKVTVQSPVTTSPTPRRLSPSSTPLRNLGTMRVVADRGLEVGDQVVMDLSAVNKATGEEIEGIKQEKFNLDTGAARLNLPGLVDGIVGMKTGETREVPITMPSATGRRRSSEASRPPSPSRFESSSRTTSRGDGRRRAVQDFPDASTIDDAKAKILESQKATTAAMLEQATNEALVDALAAICDAPLPASIVEETGRQMYSQKMLEMQVGSGLSMEVVNQLASPEMVEKFLETDRKEIELVVRRTIACESCSAWRTSRSRRRSSRRRLSPRRGV